MNELFIQASPDQDYLICFVSSKADDDKSSGPGSPEQVRSGDF
jgi:hypothetical protein